MSFIEGHWIDFSVIMVLSVKQWC